MAKSKTDFRVVTIRVISRTELAEQNLTTLLESTDSIGVYTMEGSIADLTDAEYAEIKKQVPPEVLSPEGK